MNKLVDDQYLEIMVRIRRFINLKKLKININHNQITQSGLNCFAKDYFSDFASLTNLQLLFW